MFNKDVLTAQNVLQSIKAAGHKAFEGETPYDLNLFGVRSNSALTNIFNDLVGCVYRDESLEWQIECWRATTDPGLYWLQNPGRVAGTAILIPGQYRNVYKIDKHGGKYDALCQRNGDVSVWRDADRDNLLDPDKSKVYTGRFGINIHHASYTGTSMKVNKWSAGCQVIANIEHFDRMMELARLQIKHHPTWTKFTYTLLTEDQVIT